jgi:hypothetical protein
LHNPNRSLAASEVADTRDSGRERQADLASIRYYAQHIPDARLEVVNEFGHMLPVENATTLWAGEQLCRIIY